MLARRDVCVRKWEAQVYPHAESFAHWPACVAEMFSSSIRQEGVVLRYSLVDAALCTVNAALSAAAGFAKQMRKIFTCVLRELDSRLFVWIDDISPEPILF